jgi:hypothetical protein
LAQGLAGRGVVGCRSSVWVYLAHVPPGTLRLSMRLTAQAFDRLRLIPWLEPDDDAAGPSVRVWEVGGDRPILTPAGATDDSHNDESSRFGQVIDRDVP